MTMTQSKTLKDVLYIRCFAVISLVAWHSYCIYIGSVNRTVSRL